MTQSRAVSSVPSLVCSFRLRLPELQPFMKRKHPSIFDYAPREMQCQDKCNLFSIETPISKPKISKICRKICSSDIIVKENLVQDGRTPFSNEESNYNSLHIFFFMPKVLGNIFETFMHSLITYQISPHPRTPSILS